MFQFCPHCGAKNPQLEGNKKLSCSHCDFSLYLNTASAVAVLLKHPKGYIVLKRGKNPGLGMLDLPGGFVDPDESAEKACHREVKEELGISIKNLKYLASHPNTYPYKGITYKTCDLLFTAQCDDVTITLQEEEVADFQFIDKETLPLKDFAFESIQALLKESGNGC